MYMSTQFIYNYQNNIPTHDKWKRSKVKAAPKLETSTQKERNRCFPGKAVNQAEEEKSLLTGSSQDWCFPQIRWAHFSFRQWIIINVRDYGTSFISFGCINSNFNNETSSPLFLGGKRERLRKSSHRNINPRYRLHYDRSKSTNDNLLPVLQETWLLLKIKTRDYDPLWMWRFLQ